MASRTGLASAASCTLTSFARTASAASGGCLALPHRGDPGQEEPYEPGAVGDDARLALMRNAGAGDELHIEIEQPVDGAATEDPRAVHALRVEIGLFVRLGPQAVVLSRRSGLLADEAARLAAMQRHDRPGMAGKQPDVAEGGFG